MLISMFILAGMLEIALPVILAFWLAKKCKTGWVVVAVGAAAFVLSQVVHIPLLYGLDTVFKQVGLTSFSPVLQGAYLGLMAGLCEEPARLAAYAILKKRTKPFGAALALGVGHGGIESILLAGLPTLVTPIAMLVISRSGMQLTGLTPSMVNEFFQTPVYMPLLGAYERVVAIITQIMLSVLVWQAFTTRKWGWFVLAIAWHAFVDALAVSLLGFGWSPVAIEAALFPIALINGVVIFRFWQQNRNNNNQNESSINSLEKIPE